MDKLRKDWTIDDIKKIYNEPLLKLVSIASKIHSEYHDYKKIELTTLISYKTGGCSEDCAYCAQSSKLIKDSKYLSKEEILEKANSCKQKGINRVCLSAAWKEIPESKFEEIIDIIESLKNIGLKVCLTMGQISFNQAQRLAKVGITAYNHNIDTSEDYYPKIFKKRNFNERIQTIETLIKAGIPHCCGGIIGMGEGHLDRIKLLHTLATLPVHPFTIPINGLIPIKGTPLEDKTPIESFEIVRMIAVARIIMPKSNIELAAGRIYLNNEAQTLCFLAGANAIFIGEKLLTAPNPEEENDFKLLKSLVY